MAPFALPLEAVQRTTPALRQEMGRADRERLDLLLPLIDPDSFINLGVAMQKLFPGQDREGALTAFRQFRKRLNDTAKEFGLILALEVDSRKKDNPDQRRCWFVGENCTDTAVEPLLPWMPSPFSRRSAQGGYEVRHGKPLIRYFISYANEDKALMEDIFKRLQKQFDGYEKYVFELRHAGLIPLEDTWRKSIEYAAKNCNFGLIIMTSAFVNCKNVRLQEIFSVFSEDLEYQEVVKRSILVPLEPLLLNFDTVPKKNNSLRIFNDGSKEAFTLQSDSQKDEFIKLLFKQILWIIQRPLVEHDSRYSIIPKLEGRALISSNAHVTFLDKFEETRRSDVPLSQQIDALNYLYEWIGDQSAPPYFALLGDLGVGKTTTCLAFCRGLLKKRENDRSQPLPIYLDLRHLGEKAKNELDLNFILDVVLKKSWHSGSLNSNLLPHEVIKLVQENGAIAIFDGLDEVLVHLSKGKGQDFIRELLRLLPPQLTHDLSDKKSGKKVRGRLLLSCRTHYFRTIRDQNNFLLGEGREPMGVGDYRAMILLPFSEDQILLYLKQALPEHDPTLILKTIDSVYNLREMAEQPYALSLIAQMIPQIKAKENKIIGIQLYRHMVLSWLERDEGKHQILPDHKQRMMESFAAALWRSRSSTWRIGVVEQWLIDFFLDRPDIAAHYEGSSRELLKEDLHTATFLVREGEDQFRFAHASLLEFFLACYLYHGLLEADIEKLRLPLVSRETLDFLGQLLTEDKDGRENALAVLRGAFREVYIPMASEQAFAYGLLAFEKGYPTPVLSGAHLEGADLRGWKISGQFGERLNLRGSHWCGAQLDGTNFRDLDLERADFSSSSLLRAEFLNCRAVWTRFDDASLAGAIFRENDMSHSGYLGTRFQRTKWLHCNLKGAEGLLESAPDVFYTPGTQLPYEGFKPTAPSSLELALEVLTSHFSPVNKVAYSPDGRCLASAGSDKTVHIWDSESGECLLVLRGHEEGVDDVVFAPDGQALATAGPDKTVRVWNAETGECLLVLRGHEREIKGIAYAPDGGCLASVGLDGTLRIWDTANGKCLMVLNGHEGGFGVYGVAYAPDGQRVATAGDDNTVRIWDANAGKCLLVLRGHEGLIGGYGVVFSTDGLRLASAGPDKTVRIWDTEGGDCLLVIRGHERWSKDLAFTPDGRQIASAGDDKSVRVWDSDTGECLMALHGHERWVIGVAYSPDGRMLASVGDDGTMRIWEAESGKCRSVLRIYDEPILQYAVEYAEGGRQLASAGSDKAVRVWDTESGECVLELLGHEGPVYGLAYAPDGRWLASAGDDSTLRVWDAETGYCQSVLHGHLGPIYRIAYAPDGRRLATAGADSSIRVWDGKSGECLYVLHGHVGGVYGVAYSPNGSRLASVGADKTVRIWDLESGKSLLMLLGHEGGGYSVAYTTDGRRLASAGDDGSIRVWNAETGECLLLMHGHKGGVYRVAFSPDGRQLSSVGFDQTVRVWNSKNGKCLSVLRGHEGGVFCLAYAPNGQKVASVGGDGSLRVWTLSPPKEIRKTLFFGGGAWAVVDLEHKKIVQACGDAWRRLSWCGRDQTTGRWECWPAEVFGAIPEWKG